MTEPEIEPAVCAWTPISADKIRAIAAKANINFFILSLQKIKIQTTYENKCRYQQ
jgi:hypothetical protein